MREVLIIVRREYIERVRTRAFVLGTVLFPILMVALFALPNIMEGSSTSGRHFVLIDEAPAPVGERFTTNLTTPPATGRGIHYRLDRESGSLAALQDQLNARVLAQEIDGYIALPANIVQENRVIYRARNVGNTSVVTDIRTAASQAVQAERLRRAGLEGVDVAELTRRVEVDDAALTETGTSGRGAEATGPKGRRRLWAPRASVDAVAGRRTVHRTVAGRVPALSGCGPRRADRDAISRGIAGATAPGPSL